MKTYFKPKLYVSARISPDAHIRNEEIANELSTYFEVFLPHQHQACAGDHSYIGPEVYFLDITAMQRSELAVLLPPYGRDCSFEIGWYVGKGKPVFAIVDSQTDWLRDCMVKGGLTAVYTKNRETFNRLLEDPILKFKSRFVRASIAIDLLKEFNDLSAGQIIIGGTT